ncbi:MAG: WD repeat-containing protein 70 [Paramarteilia canceri]
MKGGISAFRTIEPGDENQPVNLSSFNSSGSHVALCNSGSQVKLHDRDGVFVLETPKGYSYMSDLSNTSGHVSLITGIEFHRFEDNIFATSSIDGSIRVWDTDNSLTKHHSIYKIKNKQGKRVKAHCVGYSFDCKLLTAGLANGTIPLWDLKKSTYAPPVMEIKDQQFENVEIQSISFSSDGSKLVSRSFNGDCRLYDLRMNGKQMFCLTNLSTKYSSQNVQFSPDGSYIITTLSESPKSKACLNFYDSKSGNCIRNIHFSSKTPINCQWHLGLNQIFVSCSDGSLTGLFGLNSLDK